MKKIIYSLYILLFISSCNTSTQDEDPLSMIDAVEFGKHIEVLASDDFEGRAPSSAGEEKTINYLADQFKTIGIGPGNQDSYFQEVPLVAITTSAEAALKVEGEKGELAYEYGKDMMIWTKRVADSIKLEQSELVFVGYGIVAPEFGWNDYSDIDVKGKTVVILVNDPGYAVDD